MKAAMANGQVVYLYTPEYPRVIKNVEYVK